MEKILITGGTGSIGLAIAKILKNQGFQDNQIRLMTNDENCIFDYKSNDGKCRVIFGDVRDPSRLKLAMRGITTVFHAAAMKHIDICEENPFDAIQTNVIGTKNMIEAAIEANVENFILISTDKAVYAENTLGLSKALAEKMVLDAAAYSSFTKFSVVRFGNVIGSRGSVYQIFKKRALEGKPLIVFGDHTRFIMSLDQAASMIVNVARYHMGGGDIFVLKMKSIGILNLAYYVKSFFKSQSDVVQEHKPRKGEKIAENLLTESEMKKMKDLGDMVVVHDKFKSYPPIFNIYNSMMAEQISEKEAFQIFQEIEEDF